MVLVKSEMMVNIMAMLGLLLLIMLPKTLQLSIDSQRLDHVVARMNKAEKSYLGIILSTDNDEKRLSTSGYFEYDNEDEMPLIHAGRKFNMGKFNGVPAVYVVAKSPLAYVSATVQIMLDKFNVFGILDYGSAATLSDDLNIGDVAVLKASAYTGFWDWKNWEKSMEVDEESVRLRFGDYNVPKAGDNKLGSVEIQDVMQYTPSNSDQKTFWFDAHNAWYQVASQLNDVPLDNCVGDKCYAPKLVPGVKGSSADVLLSNEAYGQFLNHNFGVSTADRKSAATASTAIANGVPHIVLRAATNKPGEEYDQNKANLGVQNTLKLAATFAHRIFRQPRAHKLINYYYFV